MAGEQPWEDVSWYSSWTSFYLLGSLTSSSCPGPPFASSTGKADGCFFIASLMQAFLHLPLVTYNLISTFFLKLPQKVPTSPRRDTPMSTLRLMLMITAGIHLPKLVLFSNWSHHTELQSWENTRVSWASGQDNSALVSHLLEHGVISKLFQMSVTVLWLEAVGFGGGHQCHTALPIFPTMAHSHIPSLPWLPAGLWGRLERRDATVFTEKEREVTVTELGWLCLLSNANLLHKHDLPVLSV